jgi:dihydrofolate reductase
LRRRAAARGTDTPDGPSRSIAGSALLEHDLIDELRLMVFPVVLGSGKRLFGESSDKKRLRLTDSKLVGDGIVIQIYAGSRNGAA